MKSINILRKNPFTLVLSGGGALGIAHLGVFEDMEQLKLLPNEIVGTSMGGIIGACIAISMTAKQISQELDKFASVSNWIDISLRGNAIIDDEKIKLIFERIFGNKLISQTDIPLKLITEVTQYIQHLIAQEGA